MGIFKCGNPDHPFETDNLKEWLKHKKENAHTTRGVAPCSKCGAPNQKVEFTGQLHKAAPTLCKKCESEIIAGMKGDKK